MRRNRIFIILVFFNLCVSQGLAQFDFVHKYSFKVKDPRRFKFDTLLYEGMMHEFESTRKYINDFTFVESKVLGHTDTFMILNNKWVMKKGKKWVTFFSEELFNKKNGAVKWNDSYLIPRGVSTLNNSKVYTYYLSSESKLNFSDCFHYPVIFFDPKIGIVEIEYSNFSLIRVENY
jgi:hypothetical protein